MFWQDTLEAMKDQGGWRASVFAGEEKEERQDE